MNDNDEIIVKDIQDNRGITDIGAALFVKRGGDTKYHLWMLTTNIPANGSTISNIDTTVLTSRVNTGKAGRSNPGTRSVTFLAHRDNFEILKNDHRKTLDFLQVNPDGTGYKFSAQVTHYQDEATVGTALTGKADLTVTKADELPISNVMDIIQDTVTFESAIAAVVRVKAENGDGHTATINVETDPADATVTATSDTTSVATAAIASGVLTITGVAAGSAIVKVTASKTDLATGTTHILVIVE